MPYKKKGLVTEEYLVSLIVRHLSDELTAEELVELNRWAKQEPANQLFLDRMSDEARLEKEFSLWKNIDPVRAYDKWRIYRNSRRRIRVIRMTVSSVAASLIVFWTVITVIKSDTSRDGQSSHVSKAVQPVSPGRNTAILTLSDGRQVLLDSVAEGGLLTQGNMKLLKQDSVHISYEGARRDNSAALVYNVLTTPRSGQYQLTLADGTRVWLNNVSSLRYPTAFQGKDRVVELSGEAYFEVAKSPDQPFFVKTRDAKIEVLGTSFDIASYPDEGGTQTTLLTGSIRMETEKASVRLKPDEQAKVNGAGEMQVLKNVPSEDIVAWKNGFFYFGRTSFEAMMRQFSRWYDVEVIYEGSAPKMQFEGKLDRTLPLNYLLKFLDKNQIHFRLEGRKLIVLPS